MKYIRKISTKLKNRKGETLTEVLVSLLIGTLALALLAAMIGSSTRIIRTSETSMVQYYEQNNRLEERASGDEDASGKVSCSSESGTSTVRLSPGKDSVSVKCYVNQKAGKSPVISY